MPGRFGSPFRRQRLRQNEETIQRVDQAKARGDPARSKNMAVAKIAANRGANDEAKPKSSADIPEGLGALFRRRDVGDIGKRGRDVGGRDSGNDAPNKEPAKRRSQGHHNVIDAQAKAGKQNDGTAAKAVGPRADNRRKQELHRVPGEQEIAGDGGGAPKVSAFELGDQVGK